MWMILLGIHLIGLVGYNLLLRKSALGTIDKFTLATIMQTGIAIPSVALLFIWPPNIAAYSFFDFALLAFAIALTISLQITNTKAVQYLEASVFSILYNLRIVLVTIIGVLLLGEEIVELRILGGLLILLAIVIVKQRGGRMIKSIGVRWGIAAAFVLSFLNLTEKLLIGEVGFLGYFSISMIVAASLMWVYVFASKRRVDKKVLLQPKMLQLMTFRALSAFGFSGALAAGALVSVANYVSGLSVIFIVLLGAIWLNERDYLKRKVLATIVAVAGFTLVLLSGI